MIDMTTRVVLGDKVYNVTFYFDTQNQQAMVNLKDERCEVISSEPFEVAKVISPHLWPAFALDLIKYRNTDNEQETLF